MAVMSLWFGLFRRDSQPTEISHDEILNELIVNLNLKSPNGELSLINSKKKSIFTTFIPPAKELIWSFYWRNSLALV